MRVSETYFFVLFCGLSLSTMILDVTMCEAHFEVQGQNVKTSFTSGMRDQVLNLCVSIFFLPNLSILYPS